MSETGEIHAVTGAFGYSGKYIAQRLLAKGHRVITLTNSPHRPNAFEGRIEARPFDFDHPERLCESLRGVTTLYNTYWVRFNHRTFTHAQAVANTRTLFEAAKQAGVERIVHTSITNPSVTSPLEYFSCKARLEMALEESGVSHAVLRPAILFGGEDILVNNIAWALRRLPVFGVFGDGSYRLQPIYVDDFAALAVAHGEQRDNVTVNAIGPETFTYKELVKTIGRIIGKPRPVLPVPPTLAYAASRVLGALVHDVLLTRDEIHALMEGLLCVDAAPAGTTKLTEWTEAHAKDLGRRYASELARRQDRRLKY